MSTQKLELENNEKIIINGKVYLVGMALVGNDINLHCIDHLMNKNRS